MFGTTRASGSVIAPRALVCALLLVAAFAAISPLSANGAARVCRPVVNPYPGTRYEGVDLTHIRAGGVSCERARRVARGAHRRALGLGVPVSGVRRFEWNGWQVTGDLRPAHDRYVAERGAKRVRWRF